MRQRIILGTMMSFWSTKGVSDLDRFDKRMCIWMRVGKSL